MQQYKTFSLYFLLVCFFLLITNYYGQEYHNHNHHSTDLTISECSKTTLIGEPFTKHILETTNAYQVNIENNNIFSSSIQQYNDNKHIYDRYQTRQEYIRRLNKLIEDQYNIENEHDFNNHLPSSISFGLPNDTSLTNRKIQDDLIEVINKTDTISSLSPSKQIQIDQQSYLANMKILQRKSISFVKTQYHQQQLDTISCHQVEQDVLKPSVYSFQNEQYFNTVKLIKSTHRYLLFLVQIFQNENEYNSVTSKLNIESLTSVSTINTDRILIERNQRICWLLPKIFPSSFEFLNNQTLHFSNLLPEFMQTILFEHIDDHEILINTIWFNSIYIICFLYSSLFVSIVIKQRRKIKYEKEILVQCQQYKDQIEFECSTLERKNQKLLNEIDELNNLSISYKDDIAELREKYIRLQEDVTSTYVEYDKLQKDMDYKQCLIQKHEFDMQKQLEITTHLNYEIFKHQQELEKERGTIVRLQSADLSLERSEKLEEIIHQLKSEITQLKQEKFAQLDQLEQVQERANQLDIDNNQLTIKMKQLKDLLEQKDETIAQIREKILNNDNDEEKATEIDNLLSTVKENTNDNDQQELLSNINNDIEKANQHMRNLHAEIDEKTRRIKELDSLLNQEKDHCKELETKLKVVLELRERDAHLHIRQLGQTDAELRKARTDTERVRILQQQLEFKQKQLDDVQKVLSSEQTKFSEESGKLQHEIHEKWMEVKRLTRELDAARKECEGLRRQITKYANNERLSQEKTMHKPIPQHINNSSRMSSEPETNNSSSPPPPPPLPYQQGKKYDSYQFCFYR
ncbi:unnamed protein product [Rotaria sp. Silwood2]|nr:unnamed protein product [Rotaria sp. Silwood2]